MLASDVGNRTSSTRARVIRISPTCPRSAFTYHLPLTTYHCPSSRRPPTINRHHRALHELRLPATQIAHQSRNILRRPQPSNRLTHPQLLAHLLLLMRVILVEIPLHKRRLHGPRRNAFAANLFRVIHRDLPGHRQHRALAWAERHPLLHALLPRHRPDVHNRSRLISSIGSIARV